jgi:hypothetical protein
MTNMSLVFIYRAAGSSEALREASPAARLQIA